VEPKTTKEDTNAALTIKIDGKSYEVRVGEFTGRDVRDFRAVLGFTPQKVFNDPSLYGDLDAMAGLVWLVRRRAEPSLGFEKVLDSISYDNVDVVTEGDAQTQEAGDSSPEA
jgi:hypothetical protein